MLKYSGQSHQPQAASGKNFTQTEGPAPAQATAVPAVPRAQPIMDTAPMETDEATAQVQGQPAQAAQAAPPQPRDQPAVAPRGGQPAEDQGDGEVDKQGLPNQEAIEEQVRRQHMEDLEQWEMVRPQGYEERLDYRSLRGKAKQMK